MHWMVNRETLSRNFHSDVIPTFPSPTPTLLGLGPQEYDQETKDYEVARHAVFWSDEGSKTLYKNHVKCVTLAQALMCNSNAARA